MMMTDAELQRMFVRATDEVVPPAPWLEAQVVDTVHKHVPAGWRGIHLGGLGRFGPGLRVVAGLAALLIAISAVVGLLTSARLIHSTVPGRSTHVQTSTPAVIIPFAPSPAVRDPRWPSGGPVPAALAGSWQLTSSSPILHMAAYTFQLGDETPDPTRYPWNIGPDLYGNVVVNGSEIDFIAETCQYAYAYTVERYTYTLSGDTLMIARGPGQTQCGWPKLEGTYTRLSTP